MECREAGSVRICRYLSVLAGNADVVPAPLSLCVQCTCFEDAFYNACPLKKVSEGIKLTFIDKYVGFFTITSPHHMYRVLPN